MESSERFALTVVDGHAIERAALLALLRVELPQFAVVPEGESEGAESIAIIDIDLLAIEELRSRLGDLAGRHAAVVVLSSSESIETVRAVLRLPQAAFVWKGDDPAELVAAIVSVSSGRTWISETARRRFLAAGEGRRPVLSPQESRVMRSYGAGAAVRDVALDMRIAEHTVRTYIKRIRAKYREAGVALESRVDFYRNLDGHDVALRHGRRGVGAGLQEAGGGEGGGVTA